MPPLYLKDRLKKSPNQQLELTLVDRSPGPMNKKKRDGSYYIVYEFKWRTNAGDEFTESVWPETTTGKPNPLLGLLNKVSIGGRVIAMLNERGFVDYDISSDGINQDVDSQGYVPQKQTPPSSPSTPPAMPKKSEGMWEHDFILALHGVIQAQLAGGVPGHVIRGEKDESPAYSAEDWVKWIGAKAHGMAMEQVIKDL